MGMGQIIRFEIIVPIILMLVSIFEKQLRRIPSRGDWVYEYEDEKWAKIIIIIFRIAIFILGLWLLIYEIFFNK